MWCRPALARRAPCRALYQSRASRSELPTSEGNRLVPVVLRPCELRSCGQELRTARRQPRAGPDDEPVDGCLPVGNKFNERSVAAAAEAVDQIFAALVLVDRAEEAIHAGGPDCRI